MKIVVVSQNTFPAQDPRAFRTRELTEWFAQQGHEVILYTVHGKYNYEKYEEETGIQMRNIPVLLNIPTNDGARTNSLFDRIMTHFFANNLFWPHCELHFRMKEILLENKNIDLLITIAFPHSIHSGIAHAIKRKPHLKPRVWIADCGDPFMLNPFSKHPAYMKRFEYLWCNEADYITIPIEEGKSGYYPEFHHKIRIIPQGFNFERTPIDKYVPNDVPTFIYTGAIYKGIRDPHKFMDYLLNLKTPYRFKMILRSSLEKYYLTRSQGQIEYVIGLDRATVIRECSKADFLINIINPKAVQSPSKLIDYGIAGRPVLDIDSNFSDHKAFESFIEGDYSTQHVISNLNDYRIENIGMKFISLFREQAH